MFEKGQLRTKGEWAKLFESSEGAACRVAVSRGDTRLVLTRILSPGPSHFYRNEAWTAWPCHISDAFLHFPPRPICV